MVLFSFLTSFFIMGLVALVLLMLIWRDARLAIRVFTRLALGEVCQPGVKRQGRR